MKNSVDSNGNLTRDLPACSAVPQPTVQAPLHERTPKIFISRGTVTYEQVYRPERVDSVELNAVTLKLFTRTYIYSGCAERWLGNTELDCGFQCQSSMR
jgi:hypothetical protein